MMKDQIVKIKRKTTKRILEYLQEKEQTDVLSEVKQVVVSGGKGLRAAIFYQGYLSCGGKDEELAINCASSLELFHNFALIHDDIIDNSSLRRSCLSVVKKIGLSKAVLVGDYCYALANELFYQTLYSAKLKPFLIRRTQGTWQKLQEEVLLGQYQDVSLNFWDFLQKGELQNLPNIEKRVWQIMELKTASYSVIKPLLMAAALTNQTPKLVKCFSDYGKNLGLAFQIHDDILGMFGSEKIIGKPADSDLKKGKITLLMVKLLAKDGTVKLNRQRLKDVIWVRNKLESLGILAECQNITNLLIDKAKQAINNSSFLEKDKIFFNQLADFMAKRKS